MEVLTQIEVKVRQALDKITALQEENSRLKQINAEFEEKLLDLLSDLEQVEMEEVALNQGENSESDTPAANNSEIAEQEVEMNAFEATGVESNEFETPGSESSEPSTSSSSFYGS